MRKALFLALVWGMTVPLLADDLQGFFPANLGRVTAVPNGEVVLSPSLSINPSRKTLVTGDVMALAAFGSTNSITWFTIENPSGSTLTGLSTNTVQYQTGTNFSCVDILEAWDGEYRFGRAYVNVISDSEVALAGKAIIIAGRKGPTDVVWPTTDYLADLAYDSLRYRGFSKANIQYLSPVTNQDVDANGLMDDIDMQSVLTNAAHSFTNWAFNSDKLSALLGGWGCLAVGQLSVFLG